MNILILSQYYTPEKGGAVKRITSLAEKLTQLGHNVDVLTGFPNYPTGKKEKGYRKKLYMKEEIKGVNVYRTYEYASPKRNFFNRLLNYISLPISSFFYIFKRKNYDVIISSSPPLFLSVTGVLISKIKRSPLVFDVRDIWPEIAVEMGYIKEESFIYRVFNFIADFIYKRAKLVTVVNEEKKSKLLNRGVEKNKISVISNGFDESFLNNQIDYKLVEKYKLNQGNIFVYTGLVGLAQGVDIILNAAKRLKEFNDIRFLIIGDGPEKEKLEKEAAKNNLDNIEFLGLVEPENIYTFLKYASASIVPLKNKNLNDSIPSKLYEALGVGCPVILSASGAAKNIVTESKGGIVIEPDNVEELKHAVLDIYNNNVEFSKKSQDYIINNYGRKKITKKLVLELEKLFHSGGDEN